MGFEKDVERAFTKEYASLKESRISVLSIHEKIVVQGYSEDIAYAVNECYRQQKQEADLTDKEKVVYQYLDKVLTKLPCFSETITLYRGTKLPKGKIQQLIKNQQFVDDAFFSSSDFFMQWAFSAGAGWHLMRDIADFPDETFDLVIFNILKHKSGREITHYSADKSTDGREIIFLPKTKFQITGHEIHPNVNIRNVEQRDVYSVDLEEL